MDRGLEMGEWEAQEREEAALQTDKAYDALQAQARKTTKANAGYAVEILQHRLGFLRAELEALAAMAHDGAALRDAMLAAGTAALSWLPQAAAHAEGAAAKAVRLVAAALVAEGRYAEACEALARVSAVCSSVGLDLTFAALALFAESDTAKVEAAMADAIVKLPADEVSFGRGRKGEGGWGAKRRVGTWGVGGESKVETPAALIEKGREGCDLFLRSPVLLHRLHQPTMTTRPTLCGSCALNVRSPVHRQKRLRKCFGGLLQQPRAPVSAFCAAPSPSHPSVRPSVPRAAVKAQTRSASDFHCHYLEWASIHHGVQGARDALKLCVATMRKQGRGAEKRAGPVLMAFPCSLCPPSLQPGVIMPTEKLMLHAAEVELSASTPAVARLRRLFEEALGRFGETSVQLWLKYAVFELQLGDIAKARCDAPVQRRGARAGGVVSCMVPGRGVAVPALVCVVVVANTKEFILLLPRLLFLPILFRPSPVAFSGAPSKPWQNRRALLTPTPRRATRSPTAAYNL